MKPMRVAAAFALSCGLLGAGAAMAQAVADGRRSGFDDMGAQTQAMQRDDTLNPGLLWVQDGAALWSSQPTGTAAKSCAGCHGELATSMRGVAARYPAFDGVLGRPVDLAQRINLCRQRHQQAAPLAAESQPLLALESAVAHASRGLPLASTDDPRLAPFRARGEALYRQRIGQLDLSCAQCHDQRAGLRLGGSLIPQGHVNGYPTYRLEWQSLGSLQRRLRNCLTGVRAQVPDRDAPALVELALYLAWRSRGMPIETPAVRP